mgnify:CR=1 FL=1
MTNRTDKLHECWHCSSSYTPAANEQREYFSWPCLHCGSLGTFARTRQDEDNPYTKVDVLRSIDARRARARVRYFANLSRTEVK